MINHKGIVSLSLQSIQTVLAALWALVKLRLSIMVVFSSAIGYLIAAPSFDFVVFLLVISGGLLVTFAANAMNQVLEKDYDALMKRTMHRPLVTGFFTTSKVVLFAGLTCVSGVMLLSIVNIWAAFLGIISFVLYAFVYTPLKRIHPIAVLVGAIPGAMPVLIGWCSGSGSIGQEGFFLFSIQFFWQFPHFWAIAWLGKEDYAKAGFKLLPEPSGVPGAKTALYSALYTSALLVLPVLYFFQGHMHIVAMAGLIFFGFIYLKAALALYNRQDEQAAKKLLFASLYYLPVVLTLFLISKTALG